MPWFTSRVFSANRSEAIVAVAARGIFSFRLLHTSILPVLCCPPQLTNQSIGVAAC